jgi:hypothetical protein
MCKYLKKICETVLFYFILHFRSLRNFIYPIIVEEKLFDCVN